METWRKKRERGEETRKQPKAIKRKRSRTMRGSGGDDAVAEEEKFPEFPVKKYIYDFRLEIVHMICLNSVIYI